VTVSTSRSSAITDSSGTAVLEHVPDGAAVVSIARQGFFPSSKPLTVEQGAPAMISFAYIPYAVMTVKDEKTRPVAGAGIRPASDSRSVMTDSLGTSVFTNIPLDSVEFILTRTYAPDDTLTLETAREMPVTVNSAIPMVTILHPNENQTLPSAKHVVFSCTGFDFEDGILPDSSLSWQSSIDGFLGKGSELMAPVLSLGTHTVTLTGTDSDGNRGTATVTFTVTDQPPVMTILAPSTGDLYPHRDNILLSGRGFDIDDGDLPDSALVWTSNRDGFLGRGKTVIAPTLSSGFQTVTLTGTDSDGRKGTATVSFTVFDYQLSSYFPIPAGETWTYRFLVPEFYITNPDNVPEYWTVKSLTVKITPDLRRVVDIFWDVAIDKVSTHNHYTLSDSLQIENGNIYISQTTEKLNQWSTSEINSFYIQDVGTTYVPRCVFLKNVTDITKEPSYQSTVRSDTVWRTNYYGVISPVYHESVEVTTSVQVGDQSIIQTDRGIFNGTLITVDQGGAVKKWYLAKGIGPIRTDDNSLSLASVSILNDASLLRFLGSSLKTAPGVAPAVTTPLALDARTVLGDPGDVMRFPRLLAGMVAR
jgi:hypothetical protein